MAPADPRQTRPSIAERASRREQVQAGSRDRHASLLRALRAGQEVPLETGSRRRRIRWNPIAGVMLRVALVLAVAYLAVIFGARLLRESRVDTWTGPDASVQSGQRLDGCAPIQGIDDPAFPSWIRFEGQIYRLTTSNRPIGEEPDPSAYPPTGYRLAPMTLYRIANTPEGREGQIVVVRLDNSPVGRIYRRTPECA